MLVGGQGQLVGGEDDGHRTTSTKATNDENAISQLAVPVAIGHGTCGPCFRSSHNREAFLLCWMEVKDNLFGVGIAGT